MAARPGLIAQSRNFRVCNGTAPRHNDDNTSFPTRAAHEASFPNKHHSASRLLTVLTVAATTQAEEFRSIDGSGNHGSDLGEANTPLVRMMDNAYQEGVSVPRGGVTSTLPSPRSISNIVSDQTESVPNSLGASDWLWQWGQFIDHDMDFTAPDPAPTAFNIPVPMGDSDFDQLNTGTQVIPFGRSMSAAGTGTGINNPRQQMNEITSFIDASMIYGSDAIRNAALRSTVAPGMLETLLATNGEVLPMKNTAGMPNDDDHVHPEEFFLSGDVRANEQIGLTSTHTLFVREHNRIVTDLAARIADGETVLVEKQQQAIANNSNNINNQSDYLYETARKIVGAQIQKITYEEFLPVLIGNDLGSYSGYDSSVNPSVSNEFATAAYRLGHTLLSPSIKRPGIGDIELKDAFFNPAEVQQHGVDAVLFGLARQKSQELDNLLIDGVRNFLFGPPGAGGLDLASLNIQRGRDHGLPGYVAIYNEIFGINIDDFDDLGSNGLGLIADNVVALLGQAYDTVDQIDMWIGGISELPDDHGGLLGPTFSYFISDQFGRTRNGDRFYYQDGTMMEHLNLLDADFNETRLSNIILRNSSVGSIQSNVFFVSVPEPGSLLPLTLASVVAVRRRNRNCPL